MERETGYISGGEIVTNQTSHLEQVVANQSKLIATLETQLAAREKELSAEREAVRALQTKILRWSTADLRVSEAESKTYIGRGILALMDDIRTQAERIAPAAVEKAGKHV